MSKITHIQSLVDLGLSENEATCYLVILRNGASSTSDIAKNMNVLPNAVYRLLDKLEGYKMIVSLGASPMKYQAVPVKEAVSSLVQTQTKLLEESKLQAIDALSDHPSKAETRINFITGQDQFFKTFVQLAARAKKEILVISIGEPVPDEIKLATRDALDKGIDCKFIFHKSDEDNAGLFSSWVAMGVSVAHYADSGFHLLVFDGQKAVLVSSNPSETAERSGMIITSPSLANALRDFFYARWAKAASIAK